MGETREARTILHHYDDYMPEVLERQLCARRAAWLHHGLMRGYAARHNPHTLMAVMDDNPERARPMPKDYAALDPTHVRRADREMTDEAWIVEMLHKTPIGVLASVHDGQPFINSNLFFYDAEQHVLYFHTAQVGRTRANIEADRRVCFSVMEMGRLLPAPEALEFSVEYAGVVVFGEASLVEDEDEGKAALQNLLDKYFPHLVADEHYRSTTAEELKRTTVYRVQINSWSGKRKKVADDFPGAFLYGHPPAVFDKPTTYPD